MPTVIIDDKPVELAEHERLNAIQAAQRVGVEIPHYCYHPGLPVVGSCRMCLVEMGTKDPKTGRITMFPKLVPACNTPAKDGTVIVTNSDKVREARARVEEGLLLRHPVDCPICDKAGECRLQDYHFQYGQNERRADIRPFTSRRRDLGDVALFVDRCIMCSRCVRFTREVSGSKELMVINRGDHEEIDVVPGYPLHNSLSGNVVDLCPVGALADKAFLYQQRVWFMRSRPGICAGCSTGCSIWIDENQDHIYRIRPRENAQVNQWWICNEGRYGYPHVHSDQRLRQPIRRDGPHTTPLDWSLAPQELLSRLHGAGHLAGLLSPHLTIEEADLLAQLLRSVDPHALLALGPVPTVGADETFPSGFTIHAEKAPNRRGVEQVLSRFMPRVVPFEEFLDAAERGDVQGAWVSGGYKLPWIDKPTAARCARLALLVVQDLFPSPLADRAHYVLPAATFAEREGSYVNCQGLLQSAPRAIRPPAGMRTEGSLYWEMLGRPGLYQAADVLQEYQSNDN
jgi:NADH-quinone oxidoreductase subunit G